MCPPRKITGQQLREDPHIVWNEFVHLLAFSNCDDLTDIQRAAHVVFWYEHEVQNGGHVQYFVNQWHLSHSEVAAGLRRLGAACQASVFAKAAAQFTDTNLDDDLHEFDSEFHACKPPLVEALVSFLAEHRSEFVEIDGGTEMSFVPFVPRGRHINL